MPQPQTQRQEGLSNAVRSPRTGLAEQTVPTTPRPQTKPVYGLCRHVARSEDHTCGAHRCIQQYGW